MNKTRNIPLKVVDCKTITNLDGSLMTYGDIDIKLLNNPDGSISQINWEKEKSHPLRENIWQSIRTTGIGGSEAAVTNNTSRFQNLLDLYYNKTGAIPNVLSEKNIEKEYIFAFGHAMEAFVAEQFIRLFDDRFKSEFELKFSEQYNTIISIDKAEVVRDTWMYRNKAHPFMIADLDFLIKFHLSNGDILEGVFESKTSSPFQISNKWETAVPEYYFTQGSHYLAVCDYDFFVIACAADNNSKNFYAHLCFRDNDFEENLIALEKEFWYNNVLANIPPNIVDIDVQKTLIAYNNDLKGDITDKNTVLLKKSKYLCNEFDEYFDQKELSSEYAKCSATAKEQAEIHKSNIAVFLKGNKKGVFENQAGIKYQIVLKTTSKKSFTKESQLNLLKERPDLKEVFDKFTNLNESFKYDISTVKEKAPFLKKRKVS